MKLWSIISHPLQYFSTFCIQFYVSIYYAASKSYIIHLLLSVFEGTNQPTERHKS